MKTNSENQQPNTDKPPNRKRPAARPRRRSRRHFAPRISGAGGGDGNRGSDGDGVLSGDAVSATPKKGGHLIVGVNGGSTGDTLDPALCTNNTCAIVGFQWGSPLTRISPNGQVFPFLAKSFEPATAASDGFQSAARHYFP